MYLKYVLSATSAVLVCALGYAQNAQPNTPGQQNPNTNPAPGQARPNTPGQQNPNPNQAPGQARPNTPGQQNPNTNPNAAQGQRNQNPTSFPSPLYQTPGISRSLNLTQDQITRLNQLNDQLQNRYRRDFEGINRVGPTDQLPQSQSVLRRYQNDWTTGARDILNNQQLSRYNQLNLQYQGYNAFQNPDLQRQLNLTDQQLQQLRAANQWSQQQMQDINRRAATDSAQATRMYQDYRTEAQNRLNQILNEQQQRAWRGMIGDPFDFPPSFSNASRNNPNR